jgi:hypothetical protein
MSERCHGTSGATGDAGRRGWVRSIGAAALAIGLAGCSMTSSELLPSQASHTEAACASHLGAYYLPKTYLKVVIQQVTMRDKATKKLRVYNEIKELKEVRKPDRTQGYCFDYRASPTAKEKIDVARDPNFLFQYISTESLDQSAYIIKTLVRALFIGISGNKDFQPFRGDEEEVNAPRIVFDAEFDPFDVKQSAMINDALTPYQLCLVLENHTFDPRQHTINSYCNNPKGVIRHEKRSTDSALPHVRKQARGIVYRPRLPYNLYAFITKPGGHGHHRTWALASSEIVHLENEAPNLVIGIERTFFANRRATLVFDQGSLKNVCIHKTSELEQLSSVPLEIAGSIAALPTNILQVRIENSNNRKDLVEAEHNLLRTQMKHVEFLKSPAAYEPVGTKRSKASTEWVALPSPPKLTDTTGVAAGINPVPWRKDGAEEWDICPKTSGAATSFFNQNAPANDYASCNAQGVCQ